MECNNIIQIWISDRINSATLEFEQGHLVDRKCVSTNYEGNIALCDKCEKEKLPIQTIEWEKDNQSWEE